MNTYDSPRSARSRSNRFSTCAWISTSSEDTASSQITRAGSRAIARAMATRWHCPPDSSWGRRLPNTDGSRPTRSSSSRTRRRRRSAPFTPYPSSGSSTSSTTRQRGFSDPKGSWKTICTCRRAAVSRRRRSWHEVGSLEQHLARLRTRRLQQRPREGRLAGSGLAHDPERLPDVHVERNVRHRVHHPALAAPRRRARGTPARCCGPGAAVLCSVASAPLRRLVGLQGVAPLPRCSVARSSLPARLLRGTTPAHSLCSCAFPAERRRFACCAGTFGVPARPPVPRLLLLERRCGRALVRRRVAARPERAPGRQRGRVRRLARHHRQLRVRRALQQRDRPQQGAGVGHADGREQRGRRRLLHGAPARTSPPRRRRSWRPGRGRG